MKYLRYAIALLSLTGGAAHAQQVDAPDNAKAIAELKRELGIRDQVIRNLIQRIEQLERAVGEIRKADATNDTAPAGASQSAVPQNQGQKGNAAPPVPTDDAERIRAAFERTLIDRGGLTLPKWNWEIDTGLSYSHSSSEKLTIDGFTVYPVLIVGDIVSERVRRDTFTTLFSGRIGLPWQMQADVRVPFAYENSSRLSAAGEEHALSDHGLGDIELGLSRPLWHSKNGGIDVLGALHWKSTTGRDPFNLNDEQIPFGTGFNALSASVTAVTAQDPMVFFGTFTYTNDLPAERGDRNINPGDGFALQLGTALAVNLDTSLSFGYQQQFTSRTRVDGVVIPGSYINTGSFSINLSHALLSGTTIDTGLSIGLTEDSPNLQLTFSMPFRKHTKK